MKQTSRASHVLSVTPCHVGHRRAATWPLYFASPCPRKAVFPQRTLSASTWSLTCRRAAHCALVYLNPGHLNLSLPTHLFGPFTNILTSAHTPHNPHAIISFHASILSTLWLLRFIRRKIAFLLFFNWVGLGLPDKGDLVFSDSVLIYRICSSQKFCGRKLFCIYIF